MRSFVWLVITIGLSVPFALKVSLGRDFRPLWPEEAALGAIALWLLARTAPGAAPDAPSRARCALRSVLGAFVLGVSTWIHILCGGGAFFMKGTLFITAAAAFGACLGPLTVFEHHALLRAPTRRAHALAALLTGWGAFVALAGGWIQARYIDQVLESGNAPAMIRAVGDTAWWLVVDPVWTLGHFGWIVVAVAPFAWSRLRGWPSVRQAALGLAVNGAVWDLFPTDTWAITFGMICVPLALPLVARVADLKRLTPPVSDEGRVERERRPWLWIGAVLVCVVWAATLGGREAYRASKRHETRETMLAKLADWRARAGDDASKLTEEANAASAELSAIGAMKRPSLTAEERAVVARRANALAGRVAELDGAIAALQSRTTIVQVELWSEPLRENGSPPEVTALESELGTRHLQAEALAKRARDLELDVASLRKTLGAEPAPVGTGSKGR